MAPWLGQAPDRQIVGFSAAAGKNQFLGFHGQKLGDILSGLGQCRRSLLAGLVSVDAIVVSLSNLSGSGGIDLTTATYGIILAAVANTIFKTGILYSAASPLLRKMMMPVMGLMLVCTLGLLVLVK